ncbi:MAG: RdgB/HAM1 family non-canonical purine NTP pyrophosphatase [Rickettsiales bacterium]|nr:RdgB/HAM1 family non-canonical purine NTP pyrophosphatase [Rickettsiales bacterium]
MSFASISPIVIASHNQGKVKEFRALLEPLRIQVLSATDVNLEEPEETGHSFAANAELKARHAQLSSPYAALSDDSGLVIEGLGGAPGIYSARWAGPDKNWNAAFERIRTEFVLRKSSAEGASAYFICALCLCLPNGNVHHFEGRIDGILTFPPRGTYGFGYDPIFIPNGYDVTFGELDPKIKHEISHRADAFHKFVSFLKGLS